MTFLIKGMKVPEVNGCYLLTIRFDADGNRIAYPLERLCGFDDRDIRQDVPHYPITELLPHGQLKDEKQLKEYIAETITNFEEMNRNDLEYYSLIAALRTVEVMIEHIPTIIEAEIEEKE